MRYVALLRAINLGAVRQVKMAELRSLLEALGLENVSTYLQSGNAVFSSGEGDPSTIRVTLEDSIQERFGFSVPTIVRTSAEMREVVEGLPYLREATVDPTRVHAVFLDPTPPSQAWDSISLEDVAPEHLTPGPGVVYLSIPEGMQRAKTPGLVEKVAKDAVATTRNWRTVVNVLALAEGDQSR
jgi:uncharacterized protein (DUF1697 family)